MGSSCGTCAICLAELHAEEEAFLDRCFHHFHLQCIQRWAAAQLEQPAAQRGPRLACPLCRSPFTSAIYGCQDSAFSRQHFLEPPARPGSAGGAAAVTAAGSAPLTAAHRRRRAAYSSPLGAEVRQRLEGQRLLRAQAQRADVDRFVSRELQVLLLQEDVGLVAQHIVGTLRNAAAVVTGPAAAGAAGAGAAAGGSVLAPTANARLVLRQQRPLVAVRPALPLAAASGSGARPAGLSSSCPGGGVPLPAVVARLQAAAAPFLFEHAERFAWEVAAFAAAGGCSMAAYDQQVLQQDAAAAAAAGAEARRQLREQQLRQRQAERDRQAAQRGQLHVPAAAGVGVGAAEEGQEEAGMEVQAGARSNDSDGSRDSWRRQRSAEPQRSDSEGYLELLLLQGRGRQRQQHESQRQDARSGQQDGLQRPAAPLTAAQRHHEQEQEEPAARTSRPPSHRSRRSVEGSSERSSGSSSRGSGSGGSRNRDRQRERRSGPSAGRSHSEHRKHKRRRQLREHSLTRQRQRCRGGCRSSGDASRSGGVADAIPDTERPGLSAVDGGADGSAGPPGEELSELRARALAALQQHKQRA